MYKMMKTTFAVKLDEKTGMKYVTIAEDEVTKNCNIIIVTGYMPSMVDKKYRPVRSLSLLCI